MLGHGEGVSEMIIWVVVWGIKIKFLLIWVFFSGFHILIGLKM